MVLLLSVRIRQASTESGREALHLQPLRLPSPAAACRVPQLCSAVMPFVCEFASSSVACPLPSPPPPPPPEPPSPPSPPAPPTCAPIQNATFFCQQTLAKCYLLRTAAATHLNALTFCRAAGGQLVQYRTLDEQLMAETVFTLSG